MLFPPTSTGTQDWLNYRTTNHNNMEQREPISKDTTRKYQHSCVNNLTLNTALTAVGFTKLFLT